MLSAYPRRLDRGCFRQGVRRDVLFSVAAWCCMVSWCSLGDNMIGAAGAAAIAVALVHVPQLQMLQYVPW
jgi:hypothetical protein